MPPEVPAGRRAAFLLALVVAVLLAVLLAGPAAAQRAGEGEPTPGATAWVDQVMGQFVTAWEAAVGTAQQVATIERFRDRAVPEAKAAVSARVPERPARSELDERIWKANGAVLEAERDAAQLPKARKAYRAYQRFTDAEKFAKETYEQASLDAKAAWKAARAHENADRKAELEAEALRLSERVRKWRELYADSQRLTKRYLDGGGESEPLDEEAVLARLAEAKRTVAQLVEELLGKPGRPTPDDAAAARQEASRRTWASSDADTAALDAAAAADERSKRVDELIDRVRRGEQVDDAELYQVMRDWMDAEVAAVERLHEYYAARSSAGDAAQQRLAIEAAAAGAGTAEDGTGVETPVETQEDAPVTDPQAPTGDEAAKGPSALLAGGLGTEIEDEPVGGKEAAASPEGAGGARVASPRPAVAAGAEDGAAGAAAMGALPVAGSGGGPEGERCGDRQALAMCPGKLAAGERTIQVQAPAFVDQPEGILVEHPGPGIMVTTIEDLDLGPSIFVRSPEPGGGCGHTDCLLDGGEELFWEALTPEQAMLDGLSHSTWTFGSVQAIP